MTKKRSSSSSSSTIHHLFSFDTKLVISLCVLLCLLLFLSLHYRAFHSIQFEGTSKIAFLFLARRNLPLDFLWGTFFKNADMENFSIYIHSEPGFVFNESTTTSAFFYGRQLNNSIQVVWGESSMIEAERLLLEAALHDPANQRFVLLSDSCVPLYNFSYIYSYIMSSPKSFVDSFLDAKERRYSPKMSHVIPNDKWRKGSQWITLLRRHAEVVVDDNNVFPVFRKFCKRWPPINLIRGRQTLQVLDPRQTSRKHFQKHRNCIPDEHYVQTILAMSRLEEELERRTLTYTLWNQSARRGKRRSWHPVTFDYANAGPQQIKEIKVINHVYYESEYRTEWCRANSKFIPCFLFARKFTRGAAMRLLTEGLVGLYDATIQ